MEENHLSHIIQILENQLSQRLEKLWKVFNWTSSILISITAGTIALYKIKELSLTIADKTILSLIILIVTTYAFLWIKENLAFEGKIRDELDKIFEQQLDYPSLKNLRPDKARFGYKIVTLLLGIVAIVATWFRF